MSGFFERMLGNLMVGHHGGYGGSKGYPQGLGQGGGKPQQ
jgi:hypothetical protein